MSISRRSLPLLALGLALPATVPDAAFADVPDLRGASVTIPYSELRTLWEAARPKAVEKPAPPVAASLNAVRYAFTFTADPSVLECQATFDVASFTEGWNTVPLLSADARIESATPNTIPLAVRDGFVAALLDGPGQRSLTVRFSVRLAQGPDGAQSVSLGSAPALIAEASFAKIPAGRSIEVASAAAGSVAGGTVTFRLARGATLVIAVTPTDRPPAPKEIPNVWNAAAQAVVTIGDGRARFEARLTATALEGAGREMTLALPAAASISAISSDQLEPWSAKRSDDGRERKVILRWSGPERTGRDVRLSYELPFVPRDGEWSLIAPSLAGAVGQQSTFFLVPPAGLEMSPAVDVAVNVASTPATALEAALGGQSYRAISTSGEAGTSASVRVRRLPLIATAQARVETARFEMRVVPDGGLLTESGFAVQHDRPLNLRVQLPKDCELISAAVNGVDASPIDRGSGLIEFPLPTPRAGKGSEVRFSYSARVEKLAAVSGRVELELPRTEFLTNTLAWKIQLPGAYELTAFEGNVEAAPGAPHAPDAPTTEVHLRKELCKGETPRVALFYQKRAVNP